MGSHLTLYGIILFVAGILLLAYMLNRVIKRIRYVDNPPPYTKPPRSASLILIIVALLAIVGAQGFFWLSSQLKYYRPLKTAGPIAEITVYNMNDPVRSLRIHYKPATPDTSVIENVFFLSGDSWRFDGEIINFKFANGIFGLPARCYKTTSFDSRFLKRIPPNTTGALLHHNELEGGGSMAYELFRDSKYFRWFASIDTFATDYVTTEKADTLFATLEKDGTVGLAKVDSLKK